MPNLAAVLATYQEAEQAINDARAALADLPAYQREALTSRYNTPAHREALGALIPHLPATDPLPRRLHPHDAYGSGVLEYLIPVDGWAPMILGLRARHPAIPLIDRRDGSRSLIPAVYPVKRDTEQRAPIADFYIRADAHGDYPPAVTVEWYTETPGGRVRVVATLTEYAQTYHPAARVWYKPTNYHPSRKPENLRWSWSHGYGSGATGIQWWTSPGSRPPLTLIYPPGTALIHALSMGDGEEVKS